MIPCKSATKPFVPIFANINSRPDFHFSPEKPIPITTFVARAPIKRATLIMYGVIPAPFSGTLSWSVCLSFNGAATFLAFSLELLVAERVSSALVNAVDKLLAPVFSVPKPLVKLEPPFANCCETEEIC